MLFRSEELKNISYFDSSGASEYAFSKPYSEKTAELIDKEVKNLVQTQYERAKQILTKNAQGHNALAEKLVEKEVIFSDDLELLFGKRQWVSRTEEILEANKKNMLSNVSETSIEENTEMPKAELQESNNVSDEVAPSEDLTDKDSVKEDETK